MDRLTPSVVAAWLRERAARYLQIAAMLDTDDSTSAPQEAAARDDVARVSVGAVTADMLSARLRERRWRVPELAQAVGARAKDVEAILKAMPGVARNQGWWGYAESVEEDASVSRE